MKRTWYTGFFALAVVALIVGGISAFVRLDAIGRAARREATVGDVGQWDGAVPERKFIPIAPDPAAYERYEAEDAIWRDRHARQLSLSELRARGDGRRTPRQALDDRVFEYTRRGDRKQAIAELERWVARQPRDERALLALARLLNEAGRREAAVARYRQLLAVKARGRN
jgi:tetratricopeptide (TPR) repeat protein